MRKCPRPPKTPLPQGAGGGGVVECENLLKFNKVLTQLEKILYFCTRLRRDQRATNVQSTFNLKT